MKKNAIHTVIFALTILALTLAPVYGVPTGKSNDSGDYLLGTGLPHRWSAGVYGGNIERDVKYKNVTMPLETSEAMIYAGYDVASWVTLFAGGGIADHQISAMDADKSYKVEAGVLLDLIDHDILDPTLFEDKLRVNAGASWAYTEAEWFTGKASWQELTAFTTLSIVNDTVGNIFFNPNSVALYIGPMVSYIISSDLDLEQNFGYLAGIEVFISESVTLDLGIRHIDNTGFGGGIHVQF